MKILLVDPPGKNKGFNTGLAYLSAILKENHEVEVLDLNNIEVGLCGEPNVDMPIDEIETRVINAVDEFKPELFGVSVKTFTAKVSKHIFKVVHSQRPQITTVAGGPHITLDGLNFIQEAKIDFGIDGEGEYTTPQLCSALIRNDKMGNIEGIYYWENNQLVHNPRTSIIKNLDALPFPFYDNFSSIKVNGGYLMEYPILTSRGCPYNCSYCSMPKIMGQKWRPHSPDRVIEELEHAKNKYHSTSFTVVDDNFTLNLKRVENICNRLISNRINLPWNSQNGIRADRINDYIAQKMKESRCYYVWIGVESADEKVFKAIHKGERLEDIKTGIKHLKKAGIKVGGFFIVGLPYSTQESDLKSVDFVKETGIDGWWFNFVPYPHTQAWEWVQAHGNILRSSNGALQFGRNSIDPVFETDGYSKESRINVFNEINIKLNYFDRLVDPSLKQLEKWRKTFKIVMPYGPGKFFKLVIFILKYNSKLIFKKIMN